MANLTRQTAATAQSRHASISMPATGLLVLVLCVLLLLVWFSPAAYAFGGLASFLPFHTFVEIFAVVVAAMVFGIGWHAYDRDRSGGITLVATAFLGVALLDFGHMISFPGMPDAVTVSNMPKALGFWLTARFTAAAALLALVLLPGKPFVSASTRYVLLAASLAFVALVYWLVLFHEQDLPATFIPGKGLTPFKVGVEYFIIALHIATVVILLARARAYRALDVNGLIAASAVMALSEYCFTLYGDVTDAYMVLGHVYKIVAYVLLYRAVFVDTVWEPYRRLHQSERQIWQEKERAQVTLHSIGDAVITADALGRVEYLNPVAEALTGWSEREARGLPLMQIFDIVNETTRQRVENPVERCLREGRVIGLANHTVLIGRGGRESAIEDSAAPIHDREGRIIGAVMVFHDVSERRRAQERLRESEEQLRTLINAMPDIVLFKDGEGRWLESNDFTLRLLRIEDRAYKGKKNSELADAGGFYYDAMLACEAADEQAWQLGKPMRSVGGVPRPDSTPLTFDVIRVPLFHPDGRRKGLVVVGRDVTDSRKLEDDLGQLAAIVEAAPDCIGIANADGQVLYANQACNRLFGIGEAETMLGRDIRTFHPDWAYRVVKESGIPSAIENGTWKGETAILSSDAHEIPVSQVITAHRSPDGNVAFVATTIRDISERRRFEQQLAHLAHHDLLTGLPNRLLFRDRLDLALAQAHRAKERLAVMFIDLDRFKNINDTLGHALGDSLLQAAAGRLLGCVREGDTVARFGGDEFTVILPHLAQAQDASGVAQKICSALAESFVLDGHEVVVTASAGISLYPDDDETADGLIKDADAAMYQAKNFGRNAYQFYTADMNARAFEQLAMETSLRRALERNELEVYYQPRISLKSGRITGAEALLRWRHPDLGLVSPAQFIPIAEETGVIVPMGEWVLRTACAQNKAWQDAGHPPISIAVNLSARQFREPQLVERVSGALQESRLEPRYLELELTESMLMQNSEAPIVILRQFKEMGIQIAIDDFGTGFSSLSYLKRFPIGQLKIDQSFIRDISSDSNDAAIVVAIIALARSLKLEVVAEGVETPEQLGFLLNYACDSMQGFLFSRPVPTAEFTRLLEEGAKLDLA